MKMFFKHSLKLALGLSLLALLYLTWQYRQNKEAYTILEQKELAQVRMLDSLQMRLRFYSQKSLADELFIQQDFDSAWYYYQQLLSIGTEDTLLRKRKAFLQNIHEQQEKIASLSSSKEEQLASLRALDSIQRNMENIKNEYQAFKQVSSIENQSINQQYASLEAELRMLRQRNEELKSQNNVITFRSPSNKKIYYMGAVENGKANGYGMGLWETGGIYKGEWKNGLRSGKGRYEWPDGDWYEGELFLDQPHGQGVYQWKNGERYEGQWQEGKRQGQGTLYDKEGKVIQNGIWDKNVLKSKI